MKHGFEQLGLYFVTIPSPIGTPLNKVGADRRWDQTRNNHFNLIITSYLETSCYHSRQWHTKIFHGI